MNEAYFQATANLAMSLKPYPDPRFPPSPYYRFLRELASLMHPEASVELGVCGGGGSLHLAMGWPEGKVIGIDIADDHRENIDFIETHYTNFHFWLGDSVESAGAIYKRYGPISILFIDTTHTFDQTVTEFEAWKPYLAGEAVVCFDDLFRVEMDGFWEWLPEPKLRLDDLHPTAEGGFGVWWQEQEG